MWIVTADSSRRNRSACWHCWHSISNTCLLSIVCSIHDRTVRRDHREKEIKSKLSHSSPRFTTGLTMHRRSSFIYSPKTTGRHRALSLRLSFSFLRYWWIAVHCAVNDTFHTPHTHDHRKKENQRVSASAVSDRVFFSEDLFIFENNVPSLGENEWEAKFSCWSSTSMKNPNYYVVDVDDKLHSSPIHASVYRVRLLAWSPSRVFPSFNHFSTGVNCIDNNVLLF